MASLAPASFQTSCNMNRAPKNSPSPSGASLPDWKRTAEALRENEALKTAILNSSLDAIIAVDAQDLVIEFNPAAEQIFGYRKEEVLGRRLDELIIPPSLREAHARGMARYRATGEARILGRRIEITAMRADGSEFPTELTVVHVDLPGPAIFTAFVRDITERKNTQAALADAKAALEKHADELRRTVAERTADLQTTISELERFSYSLSHDMRAPLRAIHSFVEMALEDAEARLTASEKENLQRAVTAAARLDRLIQDVLNYSRVAREPIELHPVEIENLIKQIIEERPEFRPPASQITVDCALPRVIGHEAYLTQIVTNLLSNAVKFVAPGVHPSVRIHCETSERRVRIWFDDNGVGVPVEARELIFGMFQRMHDQNEYPGTGIGLTIARKAAERMKGSIGVESRDAGGSRFWIDLPAAD